MIYINDEVSRLCSAMGKEGVYPVLLSNDQKLAILAEGVSSGWYGEGELPKRILKNLYSEVLKKSVELSKQKHTL